jgi:hypothetical protein
MRWERFGNFSLFPRKTLIAQDDNKLIFRSFGAGDGDRTRAVQLGNFLLYLMFSFAVRA